MSTQVQSVNAALRAKAGKGNARAARRSGQIPAVVYGGKEAPVMISLDERSFAPLTEKAGFFTSLLDVNAEGKKFRVIPRDVQFDPVTDRPVHIDFLRVSANTRIRVHVPVVFVNQDKSPGLKRGGTINVVQHQLLLNVSPEKIPARIEIDVDGMSIGDTIHIEDIKLPDDVKAVVSGRSDSTIASIAAPTTVKEEEAKPAAAEAAAAPAAGAAGAAAPAAGAAAPAAAPAAAKAPAAKK